jgi:hypothetical protein
MKLPKRLRNEIRLLERFLKLGFLTSKGKKELQKKWDRGIRIKKITGKNKTDLQTRMKKSLKANKIIMTK